MSSAKVSRDFSQKGGGWVIAQSCLMLTVAAAGMIDRNRYAASFHQLSIAVCLFIVAAIVGGAGVINLGKNRTPYPKPRSESQLVQHGIYGLIRHPLYTSVVLWGLSWSLFWRSWIALAATLLMTVFFDAKARHEERLLRNRFPEYATYQARVRRFIPWLY